MTEHDESRPAVEDGSKNLTRSEQRKKNRLDNRGRKKSEGSADGPAVVNIFARAYNFLVEAKEELARVIWPTRKETVDSTWRLLVLVVIAGLYLGLVDGILTRLLSLIIGRNG